MRTQLTNAWHAAPSVLAAVLPPLPPPDLNAWAAANVSFGRESQLEGPYRADLFPFFARILDVLGPEHPAREVALAKSAQLGGTVLAQIFIGGTLDLDPSPMLYVLPTEPNAERWSKTKWAPFVRGTPRLAEMMAPSRARDARHSTLYQERGDGRGYLLISGANSEASLSMISMPRQVQDDLSKWELNAAGDPETQADSRSRAFADAKILKIGTPLIEDGCRITKAFKRSTQEHWHVPCPHCSHEHPLEWENMLAGLDEARPELAHFTCPACGGVIEERHKRDMVAAGRWVAHNPGAATIGFHLWSALSPLTSWRQIALDWLSAKGDPAKEQAFLNDVIGRAYSAAGEAPPSDELQKRAEAGERKPGVVPPGGLLLTMGLDCQDDRVEWQLVAFGRDLRRWVVQYGVVPGSITDRETHAALDELVRGSWTDFQGGLRPVDMLAIDGNAWTDEVYDWARRHPVARVIMVRGSQSDSAPPLAKVRRERGRDGKPKRYVGRFFNVGVSGLKLALYANLKKTDPLARGHVDLPAGLDAAYFAGLTAERRAQVTRRDGFRVWRWVKSAGQANEPLDTMLYAEAAALRLGWRTLSDSQWDRLEAEREALPAAPQLDLEDPMPATTATVAPLDAIDAELPDAEDDEAGDEGPAEVDAPAEAEPIGAALPEIKPHRPAAAVLRGVRRTGLVGRFRA